VVASRWVWLRDHPMPAWMDRKDPRPCVYFGNPCSSTAECCGQTTGDLDECYHPVTEAVTGPGRICGPNKSSAP